MRPCAVSSRGGPRTGRARRRPLGTAARGRDVFVSRDGGMKRPGVGPDSRGKGGAPPSAFCGEGGVWPRLFSYPVALARAVGEGYVREAGRVRWRQPQLSTSSGAGLTLSLTRRGGGTRIAKAPQTAGVRRSPCPHASTRGFFYLRGLQSSATPTPAIAKPTTSDACRPCPLPAKATIRRSLCVPSTVSSKQPRSTSNAPRYRCIESGRLTASRCKRGGCLA